MLRRTGSRKKLGQPAATDASPGASSKENETTTGTEKSKSPAEKSKPGAEKLKSGAEKSKSGAEKSKSGVEKSKSGAEKSTSGTEKSKSGTEKTKSGTERAKSRTRASPSRAKSAAAAAAAAAAEPVKRGVSRTSSTGSRLFGRRGSGRGSAEPGAGGEERERVVSRHHSMDSIKKVASTPTSGGEVDASGAAEAVEYREVMVNGKKKMVRVKKKSAADAAATDGHARKLVKVKVVKKSKEPPAASGAATVDSSGKPNEFNVPIKVGIPANHQLRRPQAPARTTSNDNASGVWSKAARSLFSFHEKRSKASYGEDECVDLAFQPEAPQAGGAGTGEEHLLNKSGHSRGSKSKASNYKPPTQLNGEPGLDTRNKTGEQLSPTKASTPTSPAKKPVKSEFFERFAAEQEEEEYDANAPPVFEINTNANGTRTKTKSIFQSESMLRRQFIQDQWLSLGSNYIVWEQANQKKLTDSQHTPATDYMSGESTASSMGGDAASECWDDVSEITCEDLTPPLLLKENDPNDPEDCKLDEYFYINDPQLQQEHQLDQWEALCGHRINRFGARSASTAESFVNRGMAQLRANKLEDAADSLLSAVCFLEEVHGTMASYNNRDASNSPAHMHMAQAFFLLGKVYMRQEQYPMAESALYKALNIRQLHLGKSHPDTVECFEQLGLSYLQRALQMEQQKSSSSSTTSAKALAVQRQAMEILTQVLKLKRAIFGSLHVSVAHTARVVAHLCAMQDQTDRAQRLYKQVLNVLNQLDQQETSQKNPEFPDPRDDYAQKLRKQELQDIEKEMQNIVVF